MTDDVDIAQLKLEGRCVDCKELLPNHDIGCKHHPAPHVRMAMAMLKAKAAEQQEKNKG